MSNGTRENLLQSNQLFFGACKINTFVDLTAEFEWKVMEKGDYFVNELFVYVYDPDDRIGKKYCLTNAYDWIDGPVPN